MSETVLFSYEAVINPPQNEVLDIIKEIGQHLRELDGLSEKRRQPRYLVLPHWFVCARWKAEYREQQHLLRYERRCQQQIGQLCSVLKGIGRTQE